MNQTNETPAPKSIFRAPIGPRQKASKQQRREAAQAAMMGTGQFIFENNTKGELFLPRPTISGRKRVEIGAQFLGDDYYMQMVKTGELKYIKEIQAPMTPNQLLTEQPPTVTHQGQVEYVTAAPKPLNENEHPKEPKQDVLLVEQPVDGITILS